MPGLETRCTTKLSALRQGCAANLERATEVAKRQLLQRRPVAMAKAAQARGWVPPLAWDDIDTDEAPPAADPIDSGCVQ